MERRVSLSLGRKNKQRNLPNTHDTSLSSSVSRSSSVNSTSSDHVMECSTPQHKNINLDESIEYSPKAFDQSFSPTTLLSQTLAIDSPEVGWKWSRAKLNQENASENTDLSNRAGICISPLVSSRTDRGSRVNATHRYNSRKEALDFEIRRAKKSRADALLKMRCEKIQKQLNDVKEDSNQPYSDNKEIMQQTKRCRSVAQNILTHRNAEVSPISLINNENLQEIHTGNNLLNDTLDGFLNDSEMDDVLLAATQQIESDIVDLKDFSTKTPLKAQLSDNDATPNKTKPSLYMQLLEDDLDWFTSMDDFTQQDGDAKKSRNSFQRYKSMPTDTVSSAATNELTVASGKDKNNSNKKENCKKSEYINKPTTARNTSSDGITPPKLKRRLSTQALSPYEPGNVYNRQIRLRK